MAIFIIFILDRKYPFWANFVPKNQTYLFKVKFGDSTNSNMLN